jgi:hypothetical protein
MWYGALQALNPLGERLIQHSRARAWSQLPRTKLSGTVTSSSDWEVTGRWRRFVWAISVSFGRGEDVRWREAIAHYVLQVDINLTTRMTHPEPAIPSSESLPFIAIKSC